MRKVSALPDGGCGYEVTCERQPRGEVTNGMVYGCGERGGYTERRDFILVLGTWPFDKKIPLLARSAFQSIAK